MPCLHSILFIYTYLLDSNGERFKFKRQVQTQFNDACASVFNLIYFVLKANVYFYPCEAQQNEEQQKRNLVGASICAFASYWNKYLGSDATSGWWMTIRLVSYTYCNFRSSDYEFVAINEIIG